MVIAAGRPQRPHTGALRRAKEPGKESVRMQIRFASDDGRTLVVTPADDDDGVEFEIVPAPAAEEQEADELAEGEQRPGTFRLGVRVTRLLGNALVVTSKIMARANP